MAAEAKGSGEYIIRRSGTFRNVYYTLCIQSFECERYNGLRYRLRHLIRFAARYTAAGIRDNDPRGSRGSCYLSLDNPCYRANFLSLTKFRYNLYERSRKYNKDRWCECDFFFSTFLKIKRFLRFLGTCLRAINSLDGVRNSEYKKELMELSLWDWN